MAREVYIPKLGQTVEEVTFLRWLAEEDARVEEGDGVLEVETDKANFTVEATAGGFLHRGPFKEGDVLPVLTVVAVIGKAEDRFVGVGAGGQPAHGVLLDSTKTPDSTPQAPTPIQTGMPPSRLVEDEAVFLAPFASPRARRLARARNVDLTRVTPTGYGGERVAERDVVAYLAQQPKATPLAEKVAAEAGVDLRAIAGTGVGGRVRREDVELAAKGRSPVVPAPQATSELPTGGPEVLERVPLKGIRGIIAERMAASVHATARVTLFIEVDATEMVALRERLRARVSEEWGFAPGYNDILAKIVTVALRKFAYMNARLTPDAIERLSHIHLGMATDTDRGLLVPVIRDADQKSLREFGAEFRALVERARQGKALPDDLTGGTFTITNLGMYDILGFTPVINLPEAAILGVGAITPQPVVRDGQVVVRQMMLLSLVFDHRLVDGAPAARFLQYIKDLVAEPYLLWGA